MVWNFVAQGVWHGGRWALTKAAPWVLRNTLGRKLSLGGALTIAAAPTLLSKIDNETDNALSEALLESSIGPALQTLLEVNEWSNGEKASVVTNLIDNQLEERNHLSPDDEDYARSKRMTEALGHIIIGDQIGAANIAAELGVQTSDIVESYNKARAQNPEGSLQDVGAMSFVYLREKVRQNDLQADQTAPDNIAPDATAGTVPYPNSSPNSSPNRERFSLDNLSNDGISAAFDVAAEMKGGFEGFVMKTVSFLSGIFGSNAKAFMQKTMLNMVDTETRLASLQQAARNGNLVSRMGDRFGMSMELGPEPELAT